MAETELHHAPHATGVVAIPAGPRSWSRSALRYVLVNGLEAATILVMVAEVVIVAAAVFFRYVVHRPIAGSDEVATLLLVWLTFLGGAVALRRRLHPSVNLVFERFPLPIRESV